MIKEKKPYDPQTQAKSKNSKQISLYFLITVNICSVDHRYDLFQLGICV